MKHLITIIALLSVQQFASAQNIVVNGNLEQYSTCPLNLSQLNVATGFYPATDGTPDYFNACNTSSAIGVPYNFRGQQVAASGQGYAGIYALMASANWDYSEYIAAEVPAMETGASYRVSMDISLAELSGWAIGGLGLFFYVDTLNIDAGTSGKVLLTPQVDYINYGVISDTANWVHLVDTFVADSAYKNFIIGNFKDTAQIVKTQLFVSMTSEFAYYYIDNIVIEKIVETAGISKSNTLAVTTLSPNPFSNFTTLKFNNYLHKKYALYIYDIQGMLVRRIDDIVTQEVTIERGELNAGCYFYELKSESGAAAKGKLLVQ